MSGACVSWNVVPVSKYIFKPVRNTPLDWSWILDALHLKWKVCWKYLGQWRKVNWCACCHIWFGPSCFTSLGINIGVSFFVPLGWLQSRCLCACAKYLFPHGLIPAISYLYLISSDAFEFVMWPQHSIIVWKLLNSAGILLWSVKKKSQEISTVDM